MLRLRARGCVVATPFVAEFMMIWRSAARPDTERDEGCLWQDSRRRRAWAGIHRNTGVYVSMSLFAVLAVLFQ